MLTPLDTPDFRDVIIISLLVFELGIIIRSLFVKPRKP